MQPAESKPWGRSFFQARNAMLSDCRVKSNTIKDSSVVAFKSNEIKYCQFITLQHSNRWCHLNLVATTTSLFKNPAVSQKANPSFVLRKTITTAFTAQGVALRCLQFGKVCQKLHPSRKKLLFLTYQKKRAKKKSVSILQNILCWVFFLLPNTGLGFQRLREEMGRQDSGTISSAKN